MSRLALSLQGQARALIDGKNFATVATIQPDGAPHAPHRPARIP